MSEFDDDGERRPLPLIPTPFGVRVTWSLEVTPRPRREVQLHRQRGACAGCSQPLPASLFSQPRYCDLTGAYYCASCQTASRVIPARVVRDWDFHPHAVCLQAASLLDAHWRLPLVDFGLFQPPLLKQQILLKAYRTLRRQLGELHTLLEDCDEDSAARRDLGLYDAHWFSTLSSLSDLDELQRTGPSGPVILRLQESVRLGRLHLRECAQCKLHARFCLLCDAGRTKPIYKCEPSFYECSTCRTAFHQVCFKRSVHCPVCVSR